MDTEIKEANKAAEGLAKSKHVVKDLLEEEAERMAREIGLEEDKIDKEDKEMEEDKEERRSDLFNTPQDSSNALS